MRWFFAVHSTYQHYHPEVYKFSTYALKIKWKNKFYKLHKAHLESRYVDFTFIQEFLAYCQRNWTTIHKIYIEFLRKLLIYDYIFIFNEKNNMFKKHNIITHPEIELYMHISNDKMIIEKLDTCLQQHRLFSCTLGVLNLDFLSWPKQPIS